MRKFKFGVVLTVHNKAWLLDRVLTGILTNTLEDFQLCIVLDGCHDDSEKVARETLKKYFNFSSVEIIKADNVFETKANNLGLSMLNCEYAAIVQDDMIIKESGWNLRMVKPFELFADIFAVTAQTAHNWKINPNSVHLGMTSDLDNCWSDMIIHTDHANKNTIDRETLGVRRSGNRGPLVLDYEAAKALNFFDEQFSPQDMDDHDLCYRAFKKTGKLVGCYWVDYESKSEWGGTRISGSTAPWLYKANHKNTRLFYSRHLDLIKSSSIVENRKCH